MTAAPAMQSGRTRLGWLVPVAGIIAGVLFLGFSAGAGFVVFRVGVQFVQALEPAPLAEQTSSGRAPFQQLWRAEVTRNHHDEERFPSAVTLWPSGDLPQEVWLAPADADEPWARYSLAGKRLGSKVGPRGARPIDADGDGTTEFLSVQRGKDLVIYDERGKQRATMTVPNDLHWVVVDIDEDHLPDLMGIGRDSVSLLGMDGSERLQARFRVVADATVTQWDGRRGKELLVVSTGRKSGGAQARMGLGLVLTVFDNAGEVVWEKRLGRFWYSKGVVCAVDANGRLTVALAALESSLRGLTSVQLIGLDESGSMAWRVPLGRVGSYMHGVVPMATGRFRPGRDEEIAVALDDGTLALLTTGGEEVARQAMGSHIRSLRRIPRPDQTDALVVELRDGVIVVALKP